jgi:ABC-2 type transport system ATP-binding protein
MDSIVKATHLSKNYRQFNALSDINLAIEPGKIVGLIGPNGAGKTTLLRCLLGLNNYSGELSVVGKFPKQQRASLLEDVAFIADTAVLPRWMTPHQIVDYMQGVHPKFDPDKANAFIRATNINPQKKIYTLSKGMITQLHLALVMAIDAKLLVLDEPTLGLDILYRNTFYEQLLNDYFDNDRTIIISTHQVEEIEPLLTDLLFINLGKITLDISMDQVASRYVKLNVATPLLEQARALHPINERAQLGGTVMLFEDQSHDVLKSLGTLRTPSVAELFIAKMA